MLAAYIEVIAVITSKTMILGFDISSTSFNPTVLGQFVGNLISSKIPLLPQFKRIKYYTTWNYLK
jgi:hypothetical protein